MSLAATSAELAAIVLNSQWRQLAEWFVPLGALFAGLVAFAAGIAVRFGLGFVAAVAFVAGFAGLDRFAVAGRSAGFEIETYGSLHLKYST